jgi:hypothetical protein
MLLNDVSGDVPRVESVDGVNVSAEDFALGAESTLSLHVRDMSCSFTEPRSALRSMRGRGAHRGAAFLCNSSLLACPRRARRERGSRVETNLRKQLRGLDHGGRGRAARPADRRSSGSSDGN